jgi:catechol 2,3-dioxygenase-like lactoylglutathione lyase family enzyme
MLCIRKLVRNLQVCERFYLDILGMPVLHRASVPGSPASTRRSSTLS